jgi:phage tail-like protein
MPVFRSNPYGAFNYLVSLGGAQGDGGEGTIIGGFSDVSGLDVEVNYSEYRNGNEKFNTARKIPNTYKQGNMTFKRGLVGGLWELPWNWLKNRFLVRLTY